MKGIMEEIEEMKANAKPISYSPPKTKVEFEAFIQQMEDCFQKVAEHDEKQRIERVKTQDQNLKYLRKRAKELGKEIPTELYYRLVYLEFPVDSAFIDKYQEWFEEPKKEEKIPSSDLVLEFAINNFPVRK